MISSVCSCVEKHYNIPSSAYSFLHIFKYSARFFLGNSSSFAVSVCNFRYDTENLPPPFRHSFFPCLIFPSGQYLAVIVVELENSVKLLKNPASVVDQFANAQTRRIDLVLLTKTTVTKVLSLSVIGVIAYALRFSATLIALFKIVVY
jgi:hypothetical protein